MDYEELIGLLHKELSIIFFSFIGINSLYYLIYKKCVKGILDPLLIAIIFSSLANTVPIFLYAVGAMESELFIFIILAEGGFWYTFYKTYISFPFKKQIKTNDNGSIFKILGYLSLFIVIILQLISYKLNGIPIFNESRFTNTGGVDTIVNLLMRITEPFKLYIYLYSFKLIDEKKKKGFIFLFILLSFAFLSGSKSFILVPITSYFYYTFFYKNKIPKIKIQYILLIILTPLLTFLINSDNGIERYLYRLIANGDVYWNAVFNDSIYNVKIDNPLLNLSHLFWSPLRYIIGYTPNKTDLSLVGEEIMINAYDYVSGVPNSRLPVLGWVYYGWGGIIFCVCMGFISAFCIKRLPVKQKHNLISLCYKCSFYSIGVSFITDGYLGFSKLFNLLFFLITVFFLRIIIQLYHDKSFNYNN
jgi:hypothetical protein